jgi:hypothetical protein
MALTDVYSLGANTTFQQRAMAAILNYILNTIYNECAYDIQTITVTGSPTAGNFVLTGGPLGQGTITIPYNATPAQVQVMINSIFTGTQLSCTCQGTVLPTGSVVVIWTGSLSQQPQNLMTVQANNLTGGSNPTPNIAHTVTGVAQNAHPLHSKLANAIIANPTSFLTIYPQMVACDATVQSQYTGGTPDTETQVLDPAINSAVAAQFNLWSGAY